MGRRYIYRTWKADGVVRRQYIGKVESVEAQRYLRAQEHRRKLLDQLRMMQALDDLLDESQVDLLELEVEAMQQRGYERTENRRWRVKQ